MPNPPQLYIFFGLIASGKSTLAQAWAAAIGAKYYNSDRVRKELAGLAVTAPQQESFKAGIYTTEFSKKTYDALLNNAESELSHGRSVVVDGSYQARSERARLLDVVRKHGASAVFVWCRCPEPLMKERMAQRALDPMAVSDGRWEIYLQQKARFEAPAELAANELVTLDTDTTVDDLLNRLRTLAEALPAPRTASGGQLEP